MIDMEKGGLFFGLSELTRKVHRIFLTNKSYYSFGN